MSRFVIRAVPSGVKFDLKAANGQVILTSEVYTSGAACRRGIFSVQKNAPSAHLEDQTTSPGTPLSNPKFEVYRDRAGQFRFRLKARNGKIIAVSEGYAGKSVCLDGVESVRNNAAAAVVTEE